MQIVRLRKVPREYLDKYGAAGRAPKARQLLAMVGDDDTRIRKKRALCAHAGTGRVSDHNIAETRPRHGPQHVVRLTWYVTDKRAYLAAGRDLGAAYRRVFGKHYPAMSAVQVTALMEDRAVVEIEATAVI